jgi:hypothetical protein
MLTSVGQLWITDLAQEKGGKAKKQAPVTTSTTKTPKQDTGGIKS